MKKFKLLVISLFACVAAAAQTLQGTDLILSTPSFRQKAVNVAAEAIGDSNGKYDYYIGVTTTQGLSGWISGPTSIQQSCWIVFVDEEPNSGWEHPCKYVYVKANTNPTVSDTQILDMSMPPTGISLEPMRVANRYGAQAKHKPVVPKINVNEPNIAAGHTYAVILNGGANQTSNWERYWNDCSFIYKTLRNRYEIPKQNIKVIMSDGTSDGADMNADDGSGYVSSPLDLDDDGSADIEYPATKEQLHAVLNSMAQNLTDDDHLLLFVTGHGGYDYTSNSSYLYLWNNVKLYPSELSGFLSPINAGFISIVMGQCNSGGFINALNKSNRIIITACKETERSFGLEDIPYDSFLYQWTSALSGYYANGVKANVPEKITLIKAWKFASEKDVYANGGSKYGKETPTINYFTHSVAYDLSFANIPPVVDLCFDYYSKPLVSYQRTREYVKQTWPIYRLDEEEFEATSRRFCFWNSPYIWLRNQDDGFEVQETERPIIGEIGTPIYIYVKVRNKGVKEYINSRDKMSVAGYWAKSSLAITESVWKGISAPDYEYEDNDNICGGSIGDSQIRDNIPAGACSIVRLTKRFENDDYYAMTAEPNSNVCTLAFLKRRGQNEKFPVDSFRIAAVWKTDKLAQSNVTPITTMKGHLYMDSVIVKVTNNEQTQRMLTLSVMKNNSADPAPVFSDAEVSLKLSSDLVNSWKNGGSVSESVEQDKNKSGLFKLESDGSCLKRIAMGPRQVGNISLNCNFFAENGISDTKEYDIDIALIDEATGQCLGGETFRVVQEPRPAISPMVETTVNNGRITLEATNVSEDASYYWYNANGILVGTGSTFNVPAGQQASGYTVRVEAKSDGAINYSEASMLQLTNIQSIDSRSNPNVVKVTLEDPAADNATLRIASATSNMPAADYSVESGATTCTISAAGMPSGVYQATLIENGTVTGRKKFTK